MPDDSTTEDYEEPVEMLQENHYYPFGMNMEGAWTPQIGVKNQYGFNGKENSEGDEWGVQLVQDYGFRLYNPGVGRFLSLDPLAASFPWYTPYQFAGNKPIWAIDLDGLEEEYVIAKNGKLTKPVISFMKSAFNYRQEGLENVKWYSNKNYVSVEPSLVIFKREEGIRRAINREIVDEAFKTAGAITIMTDEVIYQDYYTNRGDLKWISLIAHEQSHVEDYLILGEIPFYVKYGIDNLNLGYRGAFTEDLAYRRNGALDNWMKKAGNTAFMSRIANPFNIINEEFLKNIEKEGRRFRFENGIDAEINHLNYQTNYFKGQLNDLSKEFGTEGTHRAIQSIKGTINNIKQKIQELNDEKRDLSNEFNSKTP